MAAETDGPHSSLTSLWFQRTKFSREALKKHERYQSSSTRWPVKFNLSYNRGSEEVCLSYCPDSTARMKVSRDKYVFVHQSCNSDIKGPPHQNLEA